jgi:YD repeat-containing protein
LVAPRYEPNAINNIIGYAKFYSGSHDAVIRVYDAAWNVIETHEQAGESSTYTGFGSTLTITGERDVP